GPLGTPNVFEIWGVGVYSPDYGGGTCCITPRAVVDSSTGLPGADEGSPGDVSDEGPTPRVKVGPATPPMSGANGTTANSFDPNSLEVEVDGLDVTRAITASDGVAKTFTLAFTPKADEVTKVRYVVA